MTLSLIYRPDGGTTIDTLDLESILADNGWQQGSDDGNGSIDEVITLNVGSTSDDGLADLMQAFDLRMKRVERSRDPKQLNGVWLLAKLPHETNTRQAFITDLKRSPKIDLTGLFMGGSEPFVADYQMGLTRRLWEADTATTIATTSAINVNGGMLAYTIGGDEPARIARCVLQVGVTDRLLSEFWIGAKDAQYGNTAANFVPVWGLHKGTMAADTTVTTDATALDGNAITCTFGTYTTRVQRVAISVSQAVTTPASDQVGKYIALLRAHTTGSLECRVTLGKLYAGNVIDSTAIPDRNRLMRISNASYYAYYNLGRVDIPPWAVNGRYPVGYFTLTVDAEVVSGTGTLVMDSIVLVPAENYVHCSVPGPYAKRYSTSGYCADVAILTHPSGRLNGLLYRRSDSMPYASFTPNPQSDWALPVGTGQIVCVAGRDTSSLLDDTLSLSMDVYPRYQTLRGNK